MFHTSVDPLNLSQWLRKNTKLAYKDSICVYEYDLKRNKLHSYKNPNNSNGVSLLNERNIIYHNEKLDSYIITVTGFTFIYKLVTSLRNQIIHENFGTYNLRRAFKKRNIFYTVY